MFPLYFTLSFWKIFLYSMLLINSRGLLNITVAHVEILSAVRPFGFLHVLQAKVNTYSDILNQILRT